MPRARDEAFPVTTTTERDGTVTTYAIHIPTKHPSGILAKVTLIHAAITNPRFPAFPVMAELYDDAYPEPWRRHFESLKDYLAWLDNMALGPTRRVNGDRPLGMNGSSTWAE